MEKRKLLAKIVITLLCAPFCIYTLVNVIKSYIPPSEPWLKTPSQFEEAFNEQMEPYGLSLDLTRANYRSVPTGAAKTVSLACADGSVITCNFYATSSRKKAFIQAIEFEQAVGSEADAVYLAPLTEALLTIFETPLSLERDRGGLQTLSYQETLELCDSFLTGAEEKAIADVSAVAGEIDRFVFSREKLETQTFLRLRLIII